MDTSDSLTPRRLSAVLADFDPATLAQQFAACGYKSSHAACVLRAFYAGDDIMTSPYRA